MTFRQVVENALHKTYDPDAIRGVHCEACRKWHKIMDWYQTRYCNPDSPERRR